MSPVSNAYSAGVWSTAPSGPRARTWSSCTPCGMSVIVCGEVHGANGPRSSEHSKVASAWSAENVKVASVAPLSAAGPVRIVVSGGASVVKVWTAGVGSALSKSSTARTRSSWLPPGRSSSGR